VIYFVVVWQSGVGPAFFVREHDRRSVISRRFEMLEKQMRVILSGIEIVRR